MFSQPLKSRLPLFVVLMLLLPIVLAACGEGTPPEEFLKAIANNDKDKAKEQVCDDFKDEVDLLFAQNEGVEGRDQVKDLECTEADGRTTCNFKDSADTAMEWVFAIEDEKVCGILELDGQDVSIIFGPEAIRNSSE